MDIRIRASCVAIRDQSILLIQKHVRTYPNNGLFTLPGGGIEYYEKIKEACVREMKEETGTEVQHPTFVGIVTHRDFVDDWHTITFYFKSDNIIGEPINLEESKHTCHWVFLEAIQGHELIAPHDKDILRYCLENRSIFNMDIDRVGQKEYKWAFN